MRRFLHPAVVAAVGAQNDGAQAHPQDDPRDRPGPRRPRRGCGSACSTPPAASSGAVYDSTRAYTIKDEQGKSHRAYRLSVRAGLGEYYGIQGTDWIDPPILAAPDEERSLGGRTFELYYDGRHLRRVALQTDEGSWWVSNTLTLKLTNAQMLAIARSLSR